MQHNENPIHIQSFCLVLIFISVSSIFLNKHNLSIYTVHFPDVLQCLTVTYHSGNILNSYEKQPMVHLIAKMMEITLTPFDR